MIIYKILYELQNTNHTTGFVPTMGALHSGHISLIAESKKNCSITISSIFINPTQFNNSKDFDKYPVTIEKDIDLLCLAGCDVLFLPSQNEIYPEGEPAPPLYDIGFLETVLEGKYRPGHFQGVCQVVHRLLNIVHPGFLYLGQKDYQQCMVIKKLVEITGLKTSIIVCPTLREPNGLAMSSRNMRLNEFESIKASEIYQTLCFIKDAIRPGELKYIKLTAREQLESRGFKVDYVEIADADTLEIIENWDGKSKLVGLVAAFLNEVRLIDNMSFWG
jgi:pantoate--beta-alanine ligase